jgi:hypothetical protein
MSSYGINPLQAFSPAGPPPAAALLAANPAALPPLPATAAASYTPGALNNARVSGTSRAYATFAAALNASRGAPAMTAVNGPDALNAATCSTSAATSSPNAGFAELLNASHGGVTPVALSGLDAVNAAALPASPAAGAAGGTGAASPVAAMPRVQAAHLDSVSAEAGQAGAAPGQTDPKLRKVAGDLVANALILPVLKQNRRSVWSQNSLFSGGTGEKTFGPQFDMQLADRIAHSPRMGVTAAVANRLAAREQRVHPNVAARSQGVDVHG